MLKSMLHGQIAKLEAAFGYDGTYMHEVLDVSLGAFVKFMLFQTMSSHREGVHKNAWYAAKLAAAMSEDCGPCSQLVVNMALKARVPAASIAAVVRGDIEQADDDTAFGFRYGIAVATNHPDAASYAEEAEKRYGKRGEVSLAFTVAASRVYPAVKRGLGHGAACSKIVVANDTIAVKHAA
ncbi:MAG: hypothetical protein HY243_05870 [Proteobacteria bacterium]|nr:hypothetical protein [Pseudomonadota bacterium]